MSIDEEALSSKKDFDVALGVYQFSLTDESLGAISNFQEPMLELILLLVFGFITGCLVGMFGGGGGFYFVPVLTLLFNVRTQVAVSTSLAAIIPTTISASISHYRHGNLNVAIGTLFGIGGIIGAWLGAYISSLMPPNLLQKVFGVFMLIMGLQMTFSAKKRLRRGKQEYEPAFMQLSWYKVILTLFFGLLSGTMAGLFGLSGTPPVIAGLYILELPVNMVVGTSVFALLFNSISGLAGHLMLGQFDWRLALFLSLGAAVGAFLGPMWLGRIKRETLERIYGPIFIIPICLLGILMIFR